MTALFKTEDNFTYHDNGDIECRLCGALVRSSTTHWKWHDRESSSTSAASESVESTLTCPRCGDPLEFVDHEGMVCLNKCGVTSASVDPAMFIEAFNLLYSAQWIDHEEPRSRHRKRWFESVYEFLTKYEPLARQLRAVTEKGASGGGQR